LVVERLDKDGVRRVKKYVGGGVHFDNWLEQSREGYGAENVEMEEIAVPKSSCYEKEREIIFRIWVKIKKINFNYLQSFSIC
jgi:hypothetical protein